jgi:2,4-dienoyl-CoA reductase-like NADH-dependent reductase (Old Yellow Enzyme family)
LPWSLGVLEEPEQISSSDGDIAVVDLTEPVEIAGLTVKNRFVMPPMVRSLASEDGFVTEAVIRHYENRSKGQVGLIIVEAAAISWEHRIGMKNIGIHDDKLIPGLRRLADGIKAHGARAFIQINHSGSKTHFNTRYVGPSNIPVVKHKIPEPLSLDEIYDITQKFVDATRRAMEAGFDGVEIHGAHYYLLSEFLSGYTNRRNDEYGGTTKKKAKFSVEVIRAIRRELGDYPLIFRMNGFENVENGITIDEGIEIAKIIEHAGIDVLHISCVVDSTFNPGLPPVFDKESQPDFLKEYPYDSCIPIAGKIRPHVSVPVIGVGEVRDARLVKKVERDNMCDMLGIGRGVLADPYFIQKILEGHEEDIIPWKE